MFKCGQPGHISRDCPRGASSAQPTASVQSPSRAACGFPTRYVSWTYFCAASVRATPTCTECGTSSNSKLLKQQQLSQLLPATAAAACISSSSCSYQQQQQQQHEQQQQQQLMLLSSSC
uniref:CCHC-type domain-containing protein n=1 Tax=Ananas comosus var. bracteatus TaxID=296719 RepID=A0A6V7PH61_ANACO|nr:unnamed protein product [Ananas comosus var. bracteatus]